MKIQSLSYEGIDADFLHIPFAEIAWAFSEETFLSIKSSIEKNPFLDSARENICFSVHYCLLSRLSTLILPSFTTEMSLLSFSGKLQSSSSKERYLEFVALAVCEEFLHELFQRYPRLQESIDKTLAFWKNNVQLFLDHLREDLPEIQKTFFEGKKLTLQQLYMDLSDLHHRGRSVFQVEFDAGKLIYKPRNLKVEKAFNDLLEQINSLHFPLPLKSIQVLLKENHGWMEFVEHRPCQTTQEVKDFFLRSGINLFLWYLLEGTDAHYENLISCGAHPLMIDLETLLHPELAPTTHSLLRTGLLPFIERSHQINYGGITAEEHEIIPQMFCAWAHINTDAMQLIRKTDRVQGKRHLAHLDSAQVSFVDHIEDICTGFSHMYAFFGIHKNHFLKSAALQHLLSAKTRVVLRGTSYYSRILQQLHFPAYLKSKKEAEALLDRALTGYPQEVLDKEKEQLLDLDIPYFYSFPHSRNLYSSDDYCFKELFAHSMSELVKAHIAKLNKQEALKQQKILKSTLHCFLKKKRGSSQILKKTGLQVAQLIAEKLAPHQPLSRDMYNGSLGRALFYAALYKATNEISWKDKALALTQAFVPQESSGWCAFSGWGSYLYTHLLLGQILDSQEMLAQCPLFLKHIQEIPIEQCERLDFVGGLSGFITVLLSCYQVINYKPFVQLAVRGGENLVLKFKEERKSAMGLSHGLSGYAHALFRLYAHTKKTHFLNSAKEMIDLERAIYSDPAHVVDKNSWCHGYTGIGLSRLAHLALHDDAKVREELRWALEKTKESLGDESSLCCGDFGRFEFLMAYAKKEKSHTLEMHVRQLLFFYMHEFIRTDGQNCSLKENYQWGFMQGIAGMGYSLLRLTGMCKLPQVLLLTAV